MQSLGLAGFWGPAALPLTMQQVPDVEEEAEEGKSDLARRLKNVAFLVLDKKTEIKGQEPSSANSGKSGRPCLGCKKWDSFEQEFMPPLIAEEAVPLRHSSALSSENSFTVGGAGSADGSSVCQEHVGTPGEITLAQRNALLPKQTARVTLSPARLKERLLLPPEAGPVPSVTG
ncbi:hypothetical protein Anapl_06119 [Anas platyrhynchos]|uniref:Uncharacterized protein n=1 Tax=Anas platyrhynchos TaxID=8839 RepID=R0JMN7_ANAPL|nr:hypothetical protein Anapl_06119 [Anas platyrhynchos]